MMDKPHCVMWIYLDYDFPGEYQKHCDHDYCRGRKVK